MNNPFTNNRFKSLDSESKPVLQKEKKNNVYDIDKNSFIKPYRRDNDRRDNDRNRRNNFTSINKEKEVSKQAEFILEDEMFPDLVSTIDKAETKTSTKFMDMLNTASIEEEFTGLKPGWIEICKNKETKGLTPYEIRMNQISLIEDNPNYIMNKAIEFVLNNREKHIQLYEDINGEGTFYERFVMSPIYGPEYDTDEEEIESHSDSYDDYEYSDVYDEY